MSFAIPDDDLLRGALFCVQVLEANRGDSHGVAFPSGLEVVPGHCFSENGDVAISARLACP